MLVKLVKDIQDVPPFMTKCVDEINQELKELKELQLELKNDAFLKDLAEDGKWCAENQVFEPTRCYRLVYGSVTSVTKVDRTAGLEKLKKEGDPKGFKAPEKKAGTLPKKEEGKAQSQPGVAIGEGKKDQGQDRSNSVFIDYKDMRPTPIQVTEETVDYLNGIDEVEAEVKYLELDAQHQKEEGKPRTAEINTSNLLKHTASTQVF
jgi:hypothetical protein